MGHIPHRLSLAAQVADILRTSLQRGEWTDHLPGERYLCSLLQVSRPTLRTALEQLRQEGVLAVTPGMRRIIQMRPPKKRDARAHVVGLISPQPLHAVSPFVMYWIDALREHLAEAGCQLEVHVSHAYFTKHPAKALESLMHESRAACWALYLSTEQIQQWFADRKIPAVVIGSSHPGISLTSVDIDYHATCRHAAGLLLARGHRNIALLIQKSGMAGDLESEAGFREAFSQTEERPSIVHHNNTVGNIVARVDELLALPAPPTAFLVARTISTLAVISHLLRQGIRLPRDISLIARDSDSYLEFIVPPVARYTINPALFARKASRVVAQLVQGGTAPRRHIRIMPEFLPGETLGERLTGKQK